MSIDRLRPERLWHFIHIPKNYGTSAIRSLRRQGSTSSTDPPHTPAWCFSPDILTVALLRDPFDRLISIYSHIHRGIVKLTTVADFQRWVKEGMPTAYTTPYGNKKVNCGWVNDNLRLSILTPQTLFLSPNTQTFRIDPADKEGLWYRSLVSYLRQRAYVPVPSVARSAHHFNSFPRETSHFTNYYSDPVVYDIAYAHYYNDIVYFNERGGPFG